MGACTGPLSLTHTRTHLCTQSYTYIDIHTYGNTLINTHLCKQPYTYIQPCIQNTHAHRCTAHIPNTRVCMNMLPTAAHPTLTLGVGLSKGAARPGRERGTVSMGGGVTWPGGAASPAEGGVAGSAIREWLLRVWACFQLIIFLFLSISLTSIFFS